MGGAVKAITKLVGDVVGGVAGGLQAVAGVSEKAASSSTPNTPEAIRTTGAMADGGGSTMESTGTEQNKKKFAGARAKSLTIPLTASTTTSNTGSVGVGANTGV